MSALESRGRRDLLFASALLSLAAVFLIPLRGQAALHDARFLFCSLLLFVVVARAWTNGAPKPEVSGAESKVFNFWRYQSLLLACTTAVVFGLPMVQNFWGGYDESLWLNPQARQLWGDGWDKDLGRPLLGVGATIAFWLTPNRIEGFLLVTAVLAFANAALLKRILERLAAPGPIPIVAALFLVANRADPLRFFAMWVTLPYWMALFWYLLATAVFIDSYQRQQRTSLILSVLFLGAGLLTNEGLFPLALLGPLLLQRVPRAGETFAIWTFSWFGGIAVLAARFLSYVFVSGDKGYQVQQASSILQEPSAVLRNLGTQIGPFSEYFDIHGPLGPYWVQWTLAFVFAIILTHIGAPRPWPNRMLRTYIPWLGCSALAVLLGVLPFVTIPAVRRTQFFAAPAQATLLASLACASVAMAPVGWLRALVIVGVGVVVASSSVGSMVYQMRPEQVRFERVVHVFEQIHAISPHYPRDTLILLVRDGGPDTPLGPNANLLGLSEEVLGIPVQQANFVDPLGWAPTFGKDELSLFKWFNSSHFRYDEVVAFSLSSRGDLALLRTLPASLLPEESNADKYDPLARLRPGRVEPLPFLQLPFWLEGVEDIVETRRGVLLGTGWGALVCQRADLFRWSREGAEILINPMGSAEKSIRLEIEPTAVKGESKLRVENRAGAVTTVALSGRREVLLLPYGSNLDRVEILRLSVLNREAEGAAESSVPFRLFGPAQAGCLGSSDILHRTDALLGAGWHPLERYGDETFRWVTNDAELVFENASRSMRGLPSSEPLRIDVELEPGPGMGGKPARIQLLDFEGRVLSTMDIPVRGTATLVAPRGTRLSEGLRLHVEGGGHPIPSDSRILNFRVFSVRSIWVRE